MMIEIDTAQQYVNLAPSSQSEVDRFSDQVIESVKGGHENPLTVLRQLKCIEKASERILKEIKPELLTEASKYPTNFDYKGISIAQQDVYTKYDYTTCNDPIWDKLAKDLDEAKAALSEREKLLKLITKETPWLDPESGEVINIMPPKVSRTPGLKVTIK